MWPSFEDNGSSIMQLDGTGLMLLIVLNPDPVNQHTTHTVLSAVSYWNCSLSVSLGRVPVTSIRRAEEAN